jgi:hypothetical protein
VTGVAATADPLVMWARQMSEAHADIAMALLLESPGARDEPGVCLVMRDGTQVAWHAAGKGIDGMAYAQVPGRDIRDRLLAGERLAPPGLCLYLNFCDARAGMFAYDSGHERLAGEQEVADLRYRILYPARDRVPPLAEFFYLWGEPADEPSPAAGA